jgi:ATP-dependent protease ClpP protease subunit
MNWYEIKNQTKEKAEIYLYGEIGAWGVTASMFKRDLDAVKGVKELDVHINSIGGSVIEGIAIYNLLLNFGAKKRGYIDSLAASMASYVAMACDEIYIADNAFFMIHNPVALVAGESEDMQKAMKFLDNIKDVLISGYMRKVALTKEEVSDMMDKETTLTAKESIDMGFADEIYEPVQAVASFDLSCFKNQIPEKIQSLINKEKKMDLEKEVQELKGQVSSLQAENKKLADAPKVADFMAFAKANGLEFAENYFGKSETEIASAKLEKQKAEFKAQLDKIESDKKELENKLKTAEAKGAAEIPSFNGSENSEGSKTEAPKASAEQLKIWRNMGFTTEQIENLSKNINEVK